MMGRHGRVVGAVALLAGIAALVVSSRTGSVTWETLLAPYASGTPIVGDLRITAMDRGASNDVVLHIVRSDGSPAVQVHILPRGAWPGVRESHSFSIGYETPHSPAPERDAVTEILAQTLRGRDDGLPSPGAIPLRAADTTGLPWWLEALRATRGRAIGIALVLLALLLLECRVAPARRGRIEEGAAALARNRRPPLYLPRWRGGDAFLVLFVAAVAVRFGLGPWGPFHVNGQGPRFVDGAARDPSEIALYGPGYVEIFAPIAALAPASPDWAIFAFNALLSACAVPLIFAVARLAGVAAPIAFAAAALLLLDPISIRMSATEAYFAPIITLCLAAAALTLLGGHALANGRNGRTVLSLSAAALLMGEAARVHPSAWGLVACTPFIVLATPSLRASQRMRALLGVAALTAGVCIALSGNTLLDVFSNIRGGQLMRPMPPHSLTPLYAIAGLAVVYAIVAPQRWLAVPAALCAAVWVATRHGYDQSWLWQQAYDRLYLSMPLIAAVAVVPAALFRQRWLIIALAIGVVAIWVQRALPIIQARTTDHLEYRWLHDQIAALPPNCRVIHLASAEKRVLGIPSYLPTSRPAVAVDLRQPHTLAEALRPSSCTYYVHSSLCSSDEAASTCAELEQYFTLDAATRVSLPAIPSSYLLAYNRDPVETTLARVASTSPLGQ